MLRVAVFTSSSLIYNVRDIVTFELWLNRLEFIITYTHEVLDFHDAYMHSKG